MRQQILYAERALWRNETSDINSKSITDRIHIYHCEELGSKDACFPLVDPRAGCSDDLEVLLPGDNLSDLSLL